MSGFLLYLLAAAAPAAADPALTGLQFGFWRMAAFRARAHDLHCGVDDLDARFEARRRQLAGRYGEQAFAVPKIPKSGPGDCAIVVSVYRVNLQDWERQTATALAQPPSGSQP